MKELQSIEHEEVKAFTSKMGFNGNMAYVIREGPYYLGGAAIMPLVDIQGTEQIKNFLCHMRTDSDI
eukprot:13749023-Ditylum_brightwellii.AAC.1